jgi:hypothetical protein
VVGDATAKEAELRQELDIHLAEEAENAGLN